MTVYADLFFLTNWAMDYLLLWATGRFAAVRVRAGRLVLSAFLGAAYATAFLFAPARPLYSVAAKLVFSLLLVAVAFPVRSWSQLGRLWGCFLVLSLAAGGGALALAYLRLPGAGGPFPGVPAWSVGLAVAATLALAGQAWAYRRRCAHLPILETEVRLGGRRVTLPALVDSGNQLRDPFSGSPVMVAEYAAVRRLLPRELEGVLLGRGGLSRGAFFPFADRLRIVPFSALGSRRGVLYGFRPDGVRIKEEGSWRQLGSVVVGVCPGTLSTEGWYQALLPQGALAEREAGWGRRGG